MPLFKRKPYALSELPVSLKPNELVFQVRFTKEIFSDYQQYLKRINLYRQRVWTCKVSGKSNLTYEEALVSERRASEKVQQFPKEYKEPVLNMVQFSVLRLEELVNKIYKALKDHFVAGEEIVGVQGDYIRPCTVLRVIPLEEKEGNGNYNYEVGWLDDDKNISRTSVESAESLLRKKNPFTRALLKSFIRESATNNSIRNSPWLVHDKLCCKYKIPTDPPEEMRMLIVKQEAKNQEENRGYKRALMEDMEPEALVYKKRRKKELDGCTEHEAEEEGKKLIEISSKVKPVKYPIDDSLVQPSPDDPLFTERPVPSSDFPLSMDCIGNLLMVWNFCSSFSKTLHLSPFSLEEFEKALEYKEGEAPLLREANYALLRVALTDPVLNETFKQKRRRKGEVSLRTWKDDLCDFLEVQGREKFETQLSTIRPGYYRQLEPLAKLDILHELVDCTLGSSVIRDQLDMYIEEKQAIASQKRKEVTEEIKKEKEEQERIRSANTDDKVDGCAEATTRVYPEEINQRVVADDEELGIKTNLSCNGLRPKGATLPNGNCSHLELNYENGDAGGDNAVSASGKSRQSMLKLKAALKQAEEKEKERKRMEEQKKIQEKRKALAEVLRERKLQEKKMIELQRRQEHFEREIEKRVIRTNPLGKDRDYNRYWFFQQEGRIFFESEDSFKWGYYSAKEELDAFYGSLNPKGIREGALKRQLEKHYSKISDALQKRTKDIAQKIALEDASVRRSSRMKSTPQPPGFRSYVNKYRNL